MPTTLSSNGGISRPSPSSGSRLRPVLRRRVAALCLLGLAVTACGSTVQLSGTEQLSDGLSPGPERPGGAPTAAATAGAAPTGPSYPGLPGTTTGGTGTPGSTTGATTGTTGGATAGARVTSPISIGILDVGDTSATASSLGFKTSANATSQQLMRAMVGWYNKHGGIAGRVIKPVEYTADATSGNYDGLGAAACAAFTQDNHVAVALSQTGFELSAGYEACLTKAHVPDLNSSLAGFDATTMARNPMLFMTSAATVDRSLVAEFRGLTANGFLTPKSVIGVLVEACPYNVAAYTRTLEPLAKQLHLTLLRRDFDCVNGNDSIAGAVAQVSAAALPFRTAGVDRVTFVSNNQGAATVFFENQAASQGYKPWYALTSYSTAGPGASQISEDAQTRIKGVGWTPYSDLGTLPVPNAAAKRCRTALTEMRVPYRAGDDLMMYGVCGQFFALEEALVASNGHSDAATLTAALESRSTSPLLLGGYRTSTRTRHDSAALFAPWGYSAPCSCFAYTGAPSALAGP